MTDPETLRRVRLTVGAQSIPDATHVLPPLTVASPVSLSSSTSGPNEDTEFIIDLTVAGGNPPLFLTAGTVQAAFSPFSGLALGVGHKWVERRYHLGQWMPLESVASDVNLTGLSLSWELASLLTDGADATRELAGYALQTARGAERLGLTAVPRETPASASARAADLVDLKLRFSRAVEMRLLPRGRGFASRDVWRQALALGFDWDGHNFQWNGGARRPQITLSPVGLPREWVPERAVEGEGTLGLALTFEVPPCPDPLGVYDRMANALAFLRQQLGGVPLTTDGQELDADRLWDDRDRLQDLVQTMHDLHLAPGSPAALRFF